jgi:NTP pyrophosphatase (non-canonical NTP hydrolase)
MSRMTIIVEITNKFNRNEAKWGEQNHHPERWMNILMEEVGESSQALLKNQPTNYREELIQVAAVAIDAINSFDQNPTPQLRTNDQ